MDYTYDLSGQEALHNSQPMSLDKQERLVKRDKKPRKPRTQVACNRCRSRKIKCDGDISTGLACSTCPTVGAPECQYTRMNPRKAARLGSNKTQASYQREGDKLQVQCNFAQQPVGMNHSYNDQSTNQHSQASLMPSSTGGTFNNNIAWGNQAWDLNGRPTAFFGEQSSNMNQAKYGFDLLSRGISMEIP